MFKKLIILMLVSVFIVGSIASIDAFDHGKKHKNPFRMIWQTLFDHEDRIADLEEQPSSSGIEVYDADGQYLGIRTGRSLLIYIPSLEVDVLLSPTDGNVAEQGKYIYKSDDCTGDMYMPARWTYELGVLDDKFYAGERSDPMEVQYNSRRYGASGSCTKESRTEFAVPAQEIDLPFTTPVALPLAFE